MIKIIIVFVLIVLSLHLSWNSFKNISKDNQVLVESLKIFLYGTVLTLVSVGIMILAVTLF